MKTVFTLLFLLPNITLSASTTYNDKDFFADVGSKTDTTMVEGDGGYFDPSKNIGGRLSNLVGFPYLKVLIME